MRSLTIQVQPDRSPEIDMVKLCSAFESISVMNDLVEYHDFDRGEEGGLYFNFTFGTYQAKKLWQLIREVIFNSVEFGQYLKRSSIVACSSESGWDNYLLLSHFDPEQRVDSDADF